MSYKRWQCRKAPAFHKNDRVSYEFLDRWDVPLKTKKLWKDTTKHKYQYKPVTI